MLFSFEQKPIIMKCTSCKTGDLQPGYLDDLFPAHNCNHCGGSYVMLDDYLKWLEYAKPQDLNDPLVSVEAVADEAEDTKRAMLCPVYGTIMLKYRISKDSSHRIDINPATNGIWIDKGEWALIKAQGLAGSLNKIFTVPWQKEIKEQNAKDVLENKYLEQFGEQDYNQVKQMRQWLDKHPQRNLLVAYLAAKEPYSAIR